MIHDCWVVAVGNRHDFAETATWLEPFDAAMAGVYAERTGLDQGSAAPDGRRDLAERPEAVERGFADGLLSADDLEGRRGHVAKARDQRPAPGRAEPLQDMTRTEARGLLNRSRARLALPLSPPRPALATPAGSALRRADRPTPVLGGLP
jgi:ATP-dependent Clp protease protease subunit